MLDPLDAPLPVTEAPPAPFDPDAAPVPAPVLSLPLLPD
jgi:hypothetical protein